MQNIIEPPPATSLSARVLEPGGWRHLAARQPAQDGFGIVIGAIVGAKISNSADVVQDTSSARRTPKVIIRSG
jgi:hypothetical protein